MQILRDIRALQAHIRANAASEVVAMLKQYPALLDRLFPCSHLNPLSLAASGGHLETVVRLLELGARAVPDEERPVTPPLHEAARSGHATVVLALLEAGGDAALRDLSGDSALDAAAAGGHYDTVRTLVLAMPPEVRRRLDGPSAMAMHRAVTCGKLAMVDHFATLGTPVNAFTAMALGHLDRMTRDSGQDGLHIRHPVYRSLLAYGPQPLHYAAAESYPDACKTLLRMGADPTALTASGLSARAVGTLADVFASERLSYRARMPDSLHHITGRISNPRMADWVTREGERLLGWRQRVRATLESLNVAPMDPATAVAGGDLVALKQVLELGSREGELAPALCLACWLGWEAAADMLLEHGAPPAAELSGSHGKSGLQLVVQGRRGGNPIPSEREYAAQKRGRIAKRLATGGAVDVSGDALTFAVKSKNSAVLKALLGHWAYREQGPIDPLNRAVATAIVLPHTNALRELLERGADANGPIVDLQGLRPINVAVAWHGDMAEEMVKILLEHGADLKLRDETYDATPSDWATYGCWPDEAPSKLKGLLGQ